MMARNDKEAHMVKLKPTEYGGSDTQDTFGIQPPPHELTVEEKLRMTYKADPDDPSTPMPEVGGGG